MEYTDTPILHEYYPVIGIWVDESISNKLLKYNIKLNSIFRRIGLAHATKLPGWRYLNLNKTHDDKSEKTIRKCVDILKTYGDIFITPDYMMKLKASCLESTPKHLQDFFKLKTFNYEFLPWYQDTFKVLSKSPRNNELVFSDIPRYIIAFIDKATNPKHLLKNVPISFQNRLQNILEEITMPIITDFNEDKSELTFSGEKFHHVVDVSQNSGKLNTILTDLLSDILITRIPENSKKIVQLERNAKLMQAKSSNKFLGLFSNKSKNEGINDHIFSLILALIIVRQFDEARQLLLELLSKNDYSKYREAKFCYIHLLLLQLAPIEDISVHIKEITTDDNDIRLFSLYLLIIHTYTSKDHLIQSEQHLLQLLKDFPANSLISRAIIALCYERMASKSLIVQRKRHAARYLQIARSYYNRPNGVNPISGNAYRCSVFLQHILTTHDDPSKIFRCGVSDLDVLKHQSTTSTACWERLNAQALKTIARDLDKCGLTQNTPLIYFYLLCHSGNVVFAEKVLRGMFNSYNNLKDKSIVDNLILPYFIVRKGAKIVKYGSPEYFKYQREPFQPMIDLWEKSNRAMGNIEKIWIKSKQENPIEFVVCNEPIKFQFEIDVDKCNIPIHMKKTHVIAEVSENKIEIQKQNKNSLANKVQNDKEPEFTKSEITKKELIVSDEFIENDFCKMFTKVIDKNRQIKELEILPLKEKKFQVSKIQFQFWETAQMFMDFPLFNLQSLSKQPTLFVKINDEKDISLNDGEIKKFTISISNIGDSPIKKLYLMHDNPYSFYFSDNTMTINGFSVVPIITKSEIKENEEIILNCLVKGSTMGFVSHFVWFYEANEPLAWRHFVSQLNVLSNSKEIIDVSVFNDPRDGRKNLLFVHKNSDYTVLRGTFNGKWFEQLNIPSTNNNSVYLEETDKSDKIETWRDTFTDKSIYGGYVLISAPDKNGEMVVKQFPINAKKEIMKFDINCVDSLSLEENDVIEIDLIIKNISDKSLTNVNVICANEEQNFVFIGKTIVYVDEIGSLEEKRLTFTAFFTAPGVANIATFFIKAEGVEAISIPFKKYITVY
ncbi:hypothetical protein TVAG_470650 [Trichomonas vaginalis G3]|uniref:Uncharacterized protein n=1 Tax=Trichomonas vaginalis (strain ATCC PRA-98 / G3) TaxID=412133 RepID=A2EMB0_TRIV3|nr:hypothetical protein TVAGG3_0707400 [Trichomonas vaginalis G3]EAY06222.1 hypothetical protein TVAG_470650 [Trichomonas vaginalis G3]KAI5509653.1 hypothetical protein TVAGG3_0707400 [Trichomonas vaginalis G3]|eukprot:XP_001318445.1 hypothetical protein [Trichomonas vaginalis G3]